MCCFGEILVSRNLVRLIGVLLLLLPVLAAGQTQGTVTFGGLKNLEFINQYYDGGTGSLGSGPGPNYGLSFTSNAQAIVSASKGGSGNFIDNPGGYPVMFFQTGKNVTITAANGIQTALWFYYSALQQGAATVYSGPNGTGTVLFNTTLTPNNSGCTTYKLWTPVAVPLSATANSIVFSGTADYIAIGTIHIGYTIPTSITLVSSQNPSQQGQPVTFTATVTALGTPAVGTVTFKAANQVVGVVPVASGTAAITLSNLKVGSTEINAVFQGTGFSKAATGLLQVVNN
jgi:hypothetical protein